VVLSVSFSRIWRHSFYVSGGTNHGFLADPTAHGNADTFVFNFGKGADLNANVHAFDHGVIENATTPTLPSQAHDSNVGVMIGVARALTAVTVAQLHNHVSDFHLL
jgi:hypothetical protein